MEDASILKLYIH